MYQLTYTLNQVDRPMGERLVQNDQHHEDKKIIILQCISKTNKQMRRALLHIFRATDKIPMWRGTVEGFDTSTHVVHIIMPVSSFLYSHPPSREL